MDVSSSSLSTYCPELPPELWLEIFENLIERGGSWSERAQIRHVTWTCRLFCSLAQPILFRRLVIRFWTYSLRSPSSHEAFGIILPRLILFASDRFAHHVRYIQFSTRNSKPYGSFAYYPSNIRRTVFHNFFNLLPCFVALRTLKIDYMRVDDYIPLPLPPAPILALDIYEGPHELLPLICASKLRCLDSRSMEKIGLFNFGFHEAGKLHATLALSRDSLSQVGKLDIRVINLTEDVLSTIFLFFPGLEFVQILVKEEFAPDLPSLHRLLLTLTRIILPLNIRTLRITAVSSWYYEKTDVGPSMDILMQKYSALQTIHIRNNNIWFEWSR